MKQIDTLEIKNQRNLATLWGITLMILFPFLVVLGLLMRMAQGEITEVEPATFYSLMTLHGLGMAGALYSFAFAGLWYLNSTRITKLNIKVGYFVYAAIVVGFLGLVIGTLIGNFAPGWYMLYPMPFVGISWETWATGFVVVSLIILGVAWLIGILHLIYALSKEYDGFSNLFGWQYFKKGEVKRELPPLVMITAISLIPGVMAFIVGAAMLIMYLMQHFEPTLSFDPLMMKNMVMFFGHTLVNITMYCAVGWVYALLPEYTGREWKTNKTLVYSWNTTFFVILFAYLHHLYMDFSQNTSLHYIGQVASYVSAIPATGITMFGVVAQIFHAKMKWSVVPLTFLLGTAGWAIGGVSAVVDSTIAINNVLHNTLWVPGHFHTYMLMGVVVFIIGFLFYLFSKEGDKHKGDFIASAGLWGYIVCGYGFVLMFYLGGYFSVPRRYSNYTAIPLKNVHENGAFLAEMAAVFVGLVLLCLVIMYISLFKRLFKRKDDLGTPIENH